MTPPPPNLRVIPPRETKTHCPYCAFQCGMLVTQGEGGRLGVRADDDFPVNRGQMCIKGFTSGELIGHPDRLTSPLLRNSNGELEAVSWDSALGFIAERLLGLKRTHGNASLAAFGSG